MTPPDSTEKLDPESVREAEKILDEIFGSDAGKPFYIPEHKKIIATALSNLREQSDKYKGDAAHREMENFSLRSRLKLAEEALVKAGCQIGIYAGTGKDPMVEEAFFIIQEAIPKLREGGG